MLTFWLALALALSVNAATVYLAYGVAYRRGVRKGVAATVQSVDEILGAAMIERRGVGAPIGGVVELPGLHVARSLLFKSGAGTVV